jgi:hypothetical protein
MILLSHIAIGGAVEEFVPLILTIAYLFYRYISSMMILLGSPGKGGVRFG